MLHMLHVWNIFANINPKNEPPMLAHIPYMKHITSDIMEFHAKVSKVVVSNPNHPSSIENYGDLGIPHFQNPPYVSTFDIMA